MEKDEKGLLEAMLHRLQIMRQESEQQTALLRQLCQAMDTLGSEIARLANTNESAVLAASSAGRGRKPAGSAQPALASVSAQAALAKDLLTRSQAGFNGSGKSLDK